MNTVQKNTAVEAGAKMSVVNNNFTITTNLKNRHEAFRMLALAEATGLPLLFVGPPGTAKTNSVIDYANARVKNGGKLFIIELDEYTRAAEIKGRPNMAKLVDKNNPVYEVISPIADADYIVANEIDKASGGMRNAFLSIMAEKKLFNGETIIDLPYRAFIGTCNVIPKEEKSNPFWDRFILKYTLSRMDIKQIMEYFNSGHKNFVDNIDMKIPTKAEMEAGKGINTYKFSKLIDICYNVCSDRTITFIPRIVKAVAYIWSCNPDSALIKTAEILVGSTLAKQLADQIITKEMKNIADRIDLIPGMSDPKSLKSAIHEVKVLVTNYMKEGKLNTAQVTEIEESLANVLNTKGIDIADLGLNLGK